MSNVKLRSRLVIATALVLALTACNTNDGRELQPPAADLTRPPLPTSSTIPTAVIGPPVGSNDPASGLALSSPSFLEGGTIPARHGCPEHVSPPLSWVGVPAGTVEIAIIVADPDAGGFVHWVLTGIDPAVSGFAEGGVPETAVEARNDSSEFGWFGPCPPEGETHRYVFTLYALTSPSGVESDDGSTDAIAAITSVNGAATTLSGTFSRAG